MHWIKNLIQRVYSRMHTSRVGFRAILAFQAVHEAYIRQRNEGLKALLQTPAFANLEVLSGPFKGLRYPSARSMGSAMYPKLLGTYERELHTVVDKVLGNRYDVIVDVGAAEGYYAVGLAKHLPGTALVAVDINPVAEELIKNFAELNGVKESIRFLPGITPSELMALAQESPRGLIVSDCEGYEAALFTREVAQALAGWDLIIETHDSADQKVLQPLQQRLAQTHNVTAIYQQGRSLSQAPPLDAPPMVIRAAMDEGRTWRNAWLVGFSRQPR